MFVGKENVPGEVKTMSLNEWMQVRHRDVIKQPCVALACDLSHILYMYGPAICSPCSADVWCAPAVCGWLDVKRRHWSLRSSATVDARLLMLHRAICCGIMGDY
jgi:hypothetical protein